MTLEALGHDFGIDWTCYSNGGNGILKMYGELKRPTAQSIGKVIEKFNILAGCTWRIGKISIARMHQRSIKYECVHRAPTHIKGNLRFEIGKKYMVKGNAQGIYVCVQIQDNNVVWFLNKTKDTVERFREDYEYFVVGDTRKSFGCEASLIVHKEINKVAIIELNWVHNHDLHCFASTIRRDPANFVKDWFAIEYKKGVPPMKALRVYVDELFSEPGAQFKQVVPMICDR